MPTQKKPQDRKPKQPAVSPGDFRAEDGGFQFVGPDGEWHDLPPAADGLELLPFGRTRRLLSAGQSGQVELVFALLDVMDVEPTALDALDGLTTKQGTAVMGGWYQAGNLEGTTLPQS